MFFHRKHGGPPTLREIERIEREQLHVEEEELVELRAIERELQRQYNVHGFIITKENNMLPIAPGFSPVFTATPTPAGTALGPGIVASFTSSDTTNAPVTADATGLIGTVNIPATAVVGTVFTLTVTAINADGTTATGSANFTIVAAPPADVTGFTIAQTA